MLFRSSIQVAGVVVALLWQFLVLWKRSLTVMDAAPLLGIYVGYLWVMRRLPPQHEEGIDEIHPVPRAIARAPKATRIVAILGLFLIGGGGVFLALGMTAALLEAGRSGKGQVVDAAISDGTLNLMAYFYGNLHGGTWVNRRKANLVDGGDWRYSAWECADGKYMSTALLQPKFLRNFVAKTGIDFTGLGDPNDRDNFPAYRERMAALFRTRTRDEWTALFDGDDDKAIAELQAIIEEDQIGRAHV